MGSCVVGKQYLRLEKDKEPIWDSERARILIRDIRSKLIVVHARKNPNQKPLRIRSHPFPNKALGYQWIFAHNGTIDCPKPVSHTPKSDVDSEKFFCYFLDLLEQINDRSQFEKEEELVLAALRKSIKKTKIQSALNFILANKHNLYVARQYKANSNYYTLKYLVRSWKSEGGEKLGKRTGEVATIFSSDDISKERWTPLENGQIGIVPVGFPEKLTLRKL